MSKRKNAIAEIMASNFKARADQVSTNKIRRANACVRFYSEGVLRQLLGEDDETSS